MSSGRKTFWSDFKTFFLRGLGILLPSVLTLWLLWQVGQFLLVNVAEPINSGVRSMVIWGLPNTVGEDRLPAWFRVSDDAVEAFRASPEFAELADEIGDEPTVRDARNAVRRERLDDLWKRYDFFGFKVLDTGGLLIAIVLLYLAGALLGGFIGRRLYDRIEALLTRVPIFKQVYPHIKQLVDLIIGERKMAFRRSVLVEYPGKDSWTVGLVTGPSMAPVSAHLGGPAVAVFVPTSPTPMTGFTINVREDRVIDLDISVDEALRYVISAGVLIPDRHMIPGASDDQVRPAEGPTSGALSGPEAGPEAGSKTPAETDEAGSAA